MNITNTVRLLTVMFMFVSGFESQAYENSREALQYPESLLSMIVSPEPNNVNRVIRAECVEAVRKHIHNGGSLESNVVKQRSIPVKDYPHADLSDLDVYHYTKPESAEALTQIMHQKSYADLLSYGRNNRSSVKSWFFYVAGDSESSTWYGPKGFRFKFKPEAQIFFLKGDIPGRPRVENYRVTEKVAQELSSVNPELDACNYGQFNGEYNILTYLAAESSGVSAVLYWGFNNIYGGGMFGRAQWLQILDTSAFESMEIFK